MLISKVGPNLPQTPSHLTSSTGMMFFQSWTRFHDFHVIFLVPVSVHASETVDENTLLHRINLIPRHDNNINNNNIPSISSQRGSSWLTSENQRKNTSKRTRVREKI